MKSPMTGVRSRLRINGIRLAVALAGSALVAAGWMAWDNRSCKRKEPLFLSSIQP